MLTRPRAELQAKITCVNRAIREATSCPRISRGTGPSDVHAIAKKGVSPQHHFRRSIIFVGVKLSKKAERVPIVLECLPRTSQEAFRRDWGRQANWGAAFYGDAVLLRGFQHLLGSVNSREKHVLLQTQHLQRWVGWRRKKCGR